MTQVFRETTFKYGGREYTFTPSMSFLRGLKEKGIQNLELAQQCLRGGADALELVIVHRAMVSAAGGEVSEDESYAWLTSGNIAEITSFQTAFVQSVLPGIDLGKKPAARAKKKAPTKRKS